MQPPASDTAPAQTQSVPLSRELDVGTLWLLAAQWALFIGNIAVYIGGAHPGPLWLHMLIGVVPIHIAFTIWHEAAHGNVSRNRMVNNVVGVLGMFPYLTPYFFQRYVHLDHHKYLNVPNEDPNLIYADGPFWQLPIRYLRAFAYARDKLQADPRSPGMRLSDRLVGLVLLCVWLVALATGHVLDLVLLWLVPFAVAKVIMDWYVNYLPHVGLPAHRYLGTRIVDVGWVTPLVLQHNYHAIHHLWPGIPWHRYLRTYADKRDFLVEKHVPIEHSVFGGRTLPPLAESSPSPAEGSPPPVVETPEAEATTRP